MHSPSIVDCLYHNDGLHYAPPPPRGEERRQLLRTLHQPYSAQWPLVCGAYFIAAVLALRVSVAAFPSGSCTSLYGGNCSLYFIHTLVGPTPRSGRSVIYYPKSTARFHLVFSEKIQGISHCVRMYFRTDVFSLCVSMSCGSLALGYCSASQISIYF